LRRPADNIWGAHYPFQCCWLLNQVVISMKRPNRRNFTAWQLPICSRHVISFIAFFDVESLQRNTTRS
jgi:hypothetical protein